MIKLCLVSFSFLFVFFTNSQTKKITFNVNWDYKKSVCLPCDVNAVDKMIYSVQNKSLNISGDFDFSYTIKSINYKTITKPKYENKTLFYPSNPNVKVNFAKAKYINNVSLYLNPIILKNGVYKMVSSIELLVRYTPKQNNQTKTATFASESVLKNGSWYKFGVDKTGTFKLTKSALESAGINVASLNPKHINIYANQVAELPEDNSAYHPDDLQKNAIFIQGESDGVFNDNDYILFYLTGPQIVKNNIGVGFDLSTNLNDSLTYFYLSINANDAPKRLGVLANNSSTVTNNVSTFNEVVLHEQNNENLLKSGTNWVGEVFDVELAKTFDINLPGVSSSTPVNLKAKFVINLKNGSSGFNVNINGQNIASISNNNTNSQYDKGTNKVLNTSFTTSSSSNSTLITFSRSSPSTIGWLNKLQFNYRRNLSLSSGQLVCKDWNSVGVGNVSKFNISSANNQTQVWDVTNVTNAKKINGSLNGSIYSFTQATDTLRTFAVFNQSQAFTPKFIRAISNQNLHGLAQVDYVIVTHDLFTSQANRLADLHRNKGLTVHVIQIQDVYNEFSCGMADPVAIRWLMKMFYDRAVTAPSTAPQSLLLFGDGSYDKLNRTDKQTAFIPAYESKDSELENNPVSLITSFTSDDFYGMLDDGESMDASDLLDIGIGRFPVATLDEATAIVNKIEHYMNYGSNLFSNVTCNSDGSNSTFGDWRTRNVLIADDENTGRFVFDCEDLSALIKTEHNEMNTLKLYLDAYQQISTAGGQRYPDVEAALNQFISQGALVFNYVGHGGETGLSLERVVSIPMIEAWDNINRLPLFISATCEFSRFDDPDRTSAGEIMLLTPNGGAVAMLTTTRLVYISTNSTLVKNLYSNMFDEINGKPYSMGEIIRITKNLTAGDNNMRNFTLLGDPALKLGKPEPNIITDSINSVHILNPIDTLKALSKITISGHVEDYLGTALTNYNGVVFPTVYDKFKDRTTLGQDPDSPIIQFTEQNSIIYKGKSTVKDGKFKYTFIVPKDINYSYGKGKLSYYSNSTNQQKMGFDTSIVIGGVDPNGIVDNMGPVINLFMNDENFVNGGITDKKPLLIAKISDENGINTSGNGIGHDITVILDGNTSNPITLNNYYQADLDTYQSGQVNFQFIDLEEGNHELVFKVWDVNNNSSEATLNFTVVKKEDAAISHLLNYPNPFTTYTEFFFEHNQIHNIAEAKIEIMTVSGKLVRTIYQTVESCAYRSAGIPWDGRDEYGDKLAKGVYVYRLTIKTNDGQKADKIEKLVIL